MTTRVPRSKATEVKVATPFPVLKGEHVLQVDIDQIDLFKGIMTILKDMVEEVTIQFVPDGIHFLTMDTMHILLVQCTLNTELFSTYRCPPETLALCISVPEMVKILSCGSDTDSMRLTYKHDQETDDGTLVVNLYGKIRGKFVVGTLCSEDGAPDFELPLPSSYDFKLGVVSSDLMTACKNLKNFGEFSDWTIQNGEFRLSTKGTRTQRATFNIPSSDLDNQVTFDASFNLEHLGRILRSSSLRSANSTLRLHLTREMPLCAVFTIGNASNLIFYLAPRMDE